MSARKFSWSLVRRRIIFMGLIGLAAGILYSFGGLIIDSLASLGWVTSNETPGLSFGTVLAFGALIGMPLIGAVFGIVIGLIEGLVHLLIGYSKD